MLYQIVGIINMHPQQLCPTIAKSTTFIITYLNTVFMLHMYYTHRPYPSASALLKSSLFPTIIFMPLENFWLVLGIWRSAAFLATTPVFRIQNFVFASQYAERMVDQDFKKLPS